MKRFLLTLSLFLIATAAHAATIGSVDRIQIPGWLERGGLSVPLAPGMALQAGDTIRTGSLGRAQLKLSEGSIVKLGANARFVVESAEPKKNGVFTAAFNVLEGAFRFTTRAISKSTKRDVRIAVGRNATIGIRGTDLWGRGSAEKDIVCLIEGKIDVTGNDAKTVRLDQPLQFFQAPNGAPPEPIASISMEQLGIWGKETEIEANKGAGASGKWKIIIGGHNSRADLFATRQRLRDAGYPAEPAAKNTLVIVNLSGEPEALQLIEQLRLEQGLTELRASR